MLSNKQRTLIVTLSLAAVFSWLPQQTNACWLRNLFNRLRGQQVAYFPGTPAVENCCPPTTCCPSVTQTAVRNVVQYVPTTAYRTSWARTPVTVYRPVTTTDPYTSCQMVTYQPCATYQWQAQRVPFTTYRPVQRTVAVAVPGTPWTPVIAGSNCSTCPTTTVPQQMLVPAQAPPTLAPGIQLVPVPNNPNQVTPSRNDPADQVPSLNPDQTSDASPTWNRPRVRIDRSHAAEGFPSASEAMELRPIPNLESDPNYEAPPLLPPGDRQTALAIRLVSAHSQIEWAAQNEQSPARVKEMTYWDDGEWTAASP
jgi:hypothetical protein